MNTNSIYKNSVFYVSILITGVFIIWGIFFTENLTKVTTAFFNGTINHFGWVYLSSALFFVLFAFYLLFSKYGRIRLGKESDRPEFKTGSWLAMLFGAGMGIGIVYYAVAEPVLHYTSPPIGKGYTDTAAAEAMKYTFFHWGLQPWGIYAVIGLAFAFFQFNRGLPASVSSVFYPVLKDKIYGPIGKTIDILAVVATVFGIATSLGLGTMQITAGLNHLFNVPDTLTIQIIVIAVATVLFLISITTGLKRGIKYLSNTAIILSFTMMALIMIVGPTSSIFKVLFDTTGSYFNDWLDMSLSLQPFGEGEWINGWTLFYWAWWIAWAPFVGMFIARISKGRTISQFITGVLIVPALGTFVWLSVFGGSALHIIHNLGNPELATQITSNLSLSIFSFFDYLPLSSLLSILGFTVVAVYYITVADTATYVLGMLCEGGKLNPSNKIKITWGVIQSLVAVVLLLAGGLEVLQKVSIAAAFPFAIVMLLMCWSLIRELRNEVDINKKSVKEEKAS
ncbi:MULTISPECIES: BCCT family transporter [Bacillaceae]|uniref:Glycine/betaine ABC transporter permease n=1 Tax=Domibacillus aminovorans TaxID=29332 RepID=A0A177L2H4_9BACI|nr:MULTISPECIES: BCCT family transporter [Bacillaceae]OAH59582.1 glycine/betaine ABC transporter permease [Domibacillus aminovorans]